MNFQSMDYFTMVAQKRSFTKAAEALYITQQTLSVHIATIERELGCPLFVRHIPLELTYAGEVFLQYALDFQRKYQDLQHEFQDISNNQKGRLRIGIAYTRGRTVLPRVIEAYQTKNPKIEIQSIEGANYTLNKMLLDGEVDLAIGNFPDKVKGIALKDFYEEEIVLLVSKQLLSSVYGSETDHILRQMSTREGISPLAQCPFLLNNQQDIAGRIARSLIAKANFKPIVNARSSNVETLLDLCARGVGACFCPKNFIQSTVAKQQLSSLHVFCFQDSEVRYTIRFAWAEQAYQWSVVSSFIDTALKTQEHAAAQPNI